MVGDGPDRPELEALAHELGVARSTHFVGFQDDVGPWFHAFDALLLPSRNEGTPVSAIETLAAGRPVVASRVGGVPDVVADGTDGYLFPVGDVAAAAEHLARLAADPELRRRMGEQGRERALARYRRAAARRGRRPPLPGTAHCEGAARSRQADGRRR